MWLWLPEALRGEARETPTEEVANALTHLVGLLLASLGMYFLVIAAIVFRHSWHHVVGLLLFGISMIVLYTFSTIYHSVGIFYYEQVEVMSRFRVLDHVAIYWLIAGSYSPLVLILLVRAKISPKLGYIMLSVVWGCALFGSVFKVFFFDLISESTSNLLYLAMGWMSVVVAKPFATKAPRKIMWWIVIGGIAYSGGVLFLIFDDLHFNHSIWHLFVMIGTASHFVSVALTMFVEQHLGPRDQLTPHLKLSAKRAMRMLVSLKRPTQPTPKAPRPPHLQED